MTDASLTPDEKELAMLAKAAARDASAAVGPEPVPGDAAQEDAAARRALDVIGAAGLLERIAPADGSVPSARQVCVIREQLAWACGLADVMFVMQGLGACALTLAGNAELKTRMLPGVAAGRIIAGFALTEPDAGSDVSAITTRASRDGDHYVLDGVKTFISNAGLADLYTVFARTGEAASGRRGLTAFAVEAGAPGLRLRERITVSAPHPIGTLALSGCRVPAANRLGEEGSGHEIALKVLDRFRPTVGAAASGFARRALDESLTRARTRIQFGKPLAEFQAIRFKLADMATWLDASRLLVMRAAGLIDTGADARRASAMAKLYATEAAQRIVDEAVQIHGGLGVTRGHIVERLYREVRALRIYEGTSEIQRSIIAHSLLKETA